MKTLIINNHTKYINELSSIFSDVDIISKENLTKIYDVSNYDLIVLSGGLNVPTVLRHPEEYKCEIELIKNTNIPIIGICLGLEIITVAFNGELQELPEEHRGLIKLQIINSDLEKALGSSTLEVTESHRISIKQMPHHFISYAQSEHGIEIIKHKDKPIIGFQFHPEVSSNKKLLNWMFRSLNLTN